MCCFFNWLFIQIHYILVYKKQKTKHMKKKQKKGQKKETNDLVLLLTTFDRFNKDREKLFIGLYFPLGGQLKLKDTTIVTSTIKVSLLKKDGNNSIHLEFESEKIDLSLEETTIEMLNNAYIIITKDDIEKAMMRAGKVITDLLDLI